MVAGQRSRQNRRQARADITLESYASHRPEYVRLQTVAIDGFTTWLQDLNCLAHIDILFQALRLLALLLKAYGIMHKISKATKVEEPESCFSFSKARVELC